MNVVTKSGTNLWTGSAFEFFRDKSMNAQTETEILAAGTGTPVKGDYRRNQFGGSFGGPIVKDKAHFFVAVERTQQDTTQAVNTQGLFPGQDGVFADAVPRDAVHRQGDGEPQREPVPVGALRPQQNSQPYGAAPNSTPDNWGDSTNKFNSINLNHNWVLGGSKLNEFIFQYADFGNNIAARSRRPERDLPERRDDRRERQHAADDAAEEVPVPRRLLVAQERRRRPRPRLQGRRELHQRAAPVHHVQHRQGRGVQHAHRPTT